MLTGYYVPAIKPFVGLADSNMCTPAIAARARRDKICQCFLASNRCEARMFEQHQQPLQTLPFQTHGAQSGKLIGAGLLMAGERRFHARGRALMWTRPAPQPHVSAWGGFLLWEPGFWIGFLYIHNRQASRLATLICKYVYDLCSVNRDWYN